MFLSMDGSMDIDDDNDNSSPWMNTRNWLKLRVEDDKKFSRSSRNFL